MSTMHIYVNKVTCNDWEGWPVDAAEPETIYPDSITAWLVEWVFI